MTRQLNETAPVLRSCQQVREELLAGREIALLDVREEDPHAQAHPLFAAHFAFGRIEVDAYARLPRRDVPIVVLDGGEGLAAQGRPVEAGPTRLASPLIDRYRRPYEGTDNQAAAMQAYLDWEYGLVAQLGRDGTHGFRVLA